MVANLYISAQVIETTTFIIIPQSRATLRGTVVLTSDDNGSTWQYESDSAEDVDYIGGFSHGSVAYLFGMESSFSETRIHKVISVNPFTFESIAFEEFDPDNYIVGVAKHNDTKIVALLSYSGTSEDVFVSFSFDLCKTWDSISFAPPSFLLPDLMRIHADNSDQNGSFYVTSGEGWVAKLDPSGRKLVSLTSLQDQPYDFAQSAL